MDKKKILICDDDAGILDVLEMILLETGHTIIPEINSLNILTLIHSEAPDLVILDLWMPILSGDQLVQMIRENPAFNDLPIVVISASPDGKEIAMDAGASEFLAKPFDYEELLQIVAKLLA